MATQQNFTLAQEQANNFLGPVKGALGSPVAERTSDYFAVFNGAGGTGPEIIDQTAIFINYIVDSNGNLSQPTAEYSSRLNLIQNFEVGSNAIIRNNTGATLDGNILAKHKITAIGRQIPLLYSATGSTAGANVDTLNFDSELNQSTTPDMKGTMIKDGFLPDGSYTSYVTLIGYETPLINPEAGSASWNNGAGAYVVAAGLTGVENITFAITGQIRNLAGTQSVNVRLRLVSEGTPRATKVYTIPPGATLDLSSDALIFTAESDLLDNNPSFTLQLQTDNPSIVQVSYIQFNITNQSPEPGAVVSNTPFWTQGSGDDNLWVTASAEISTNYGNIQNSKPVTDLASANNFNLSEITAEFLVRVGDRIRFEYNPNTEYFIYEVLTPKNASDGLLKLRLNKKVPSSVNKDNFILHRVDVEDPVYIIFDVKKRDISPAGEIFKGVILPEFPTQKLRDNLDNLILELREKGILPQEQ